MTVTCRRCGKPMQLLDEENQKWYCHKDDELYYAKENHWGSMPTESPTFDTGAGTPPPPVRLIDVWAPLIFLLLLLIVGWLEIVRHLFVSSGVLLIMWELLAPITLIGATLYVHYDSKKFNIGGGIALIVLLLAIVGLPLYAYDLHKLRKQQMTGRVPINQQSTQSISYCNICPRINSHLHYSNLHDSLVKLGLGAFISAEVIGGIVGVVKGSTTLYFDYSTIASYNFVAYKITQLTAAYQPLIDMSYVFEVVALSLAIIAGITLHSSSKKELHRAVLISAFIFGLLTIATRYYYYSLTAEALTALPSVVNQETFSAYSRAEQQFQVAYGFWGKPADSLNGILSILSMASLGVAAAIAKPRLVWTRTESYPQEPTTVEPIPQTVTPSKEEEHRTTTSELKYCRYCGAKIPRQSKFCEECGKSLVG